MPGELSELMLQAWELGQAASPGQRGLLLLGVAEPGVPEASRAGFTVGQRDGALLDLFERAFGGVMPTLADCPSCGETLELDVPVGAIRVSPPAPPEPRVLSWAGVEITYRLPNAADLAVMGGNGVGSAARWLARRCVMPAGAAIEEDAAEALEQALDEAVMEDDPQAVITLDFGCTDCGRDWTARFDIVEFLWRRIDNFACELLRDVHVLASAYGWSERDILALASSRRRHYLELLGA